MRLPLRPVSVRHAVRSSVPVAATSPAAPAARAARPERDDAPRFASQIEAARALRDRLDRDAMTHDGNDAA